MPGASRWATVEPYLDTTLYAHVFGEDRTRVQAYDLYDEVYWTSPDTFRLTMRDQEGDPIYVPAGRKVVETANRYLANGMEVVADAEFGTDAERRDATAFFIDFARRERLYSKFAANKRKGLIKGDWLWHVWADPERPEGMRVSIGALDPATYFPERNEAGDIVAVHLVEPTLDPEGKPLTRRLTYAKETGLGGPSGILVSDATYDPEEWGQPDTDMPLGRRVQTFRMEESLPPEITAIPVYHVPNVFDADDPWGSSEMRGIERLMSAINQAITDEDLALVLEGIGFYATTAGAPIDEATGEVKPWTIAVGRVVELPPGTDFKRVTGATSVTPYMEHLKYLHDRVDDATDTSDVSRVDVAVAESGIALTLRMAPLLARMAEKEIVVTDVTVNLLYDLRTWFMAYEGLRGLEAVRWVPRYGPKLPVNREEVFEQVLRMATGENPLISGTEARRLLAGIGDDFTDETTLVTQILQEQSDLASVRADAEAMRMGLEVGEPSV